MKTIFLLAALFAHQIVAVPASAADDSSEAWSELSGIRQVSGTWTTQDGTVSGATDAGDVFARSDEIASDFVLEADITLTAGKGAAAVVFRASADVSRLYAVTLDHSLHVAAVPVAHPNRPSRCSAGLDRRHDLPRTRISPAGL